MSGTLRENVARRSHVSLEDLRAVDLLLDKAGIHCPYEKIERLGGMTNKTFHLYVEDGEDLICRLPGPGTEELINREDERKSNRLACELDIDTKVYYFDSKGYKISHCIEDAHTMEAKDLREKDHIAEVAEIFSTLHNSGVDTGVPFEVFDMAQSYENFINKHDVALYEDYEEVKNEVFKIKAEVAREMEIHKVPCHNDSLCANWIYGEDRLFLVDWEYAGMNDPMWDLADVSIEANYKEEEDHYLLRAYFGREPKPEEYHNFVANKIYLDYLWTLWGLTRVPFDKETMEQYALVRYYRLKKNIARYRQA